MYIEVAFRIDSERTQTRMIEPVDVTESSFESAPPSRKEEIDGNWIRKERKSGKVEEN